MRAPGPKEPPPVPAEAISFGILGFVIFPGFVEFRQPRSKHHKFQQLVRQLVQQRVQQLVQQQVRQLVRQLVQQLVQPRPKKTYKSFWGVRGKCTQGVRKARARCAQDARKVRARSARDARATRHVSLDRYIYLSRDTCVVAQGARTWA